LYHEIFAQGNSEGITFVASSGDEGGLLCPSIDYFNYVPDTSWVPGVSSPADDPDVTAVGGGNLVTTFSSKSLNSAYVSEDGIGDAEIPYDPFGLGVNVDGGYWGAGGGVSSVFPKPSYQNLVNTGSNSYRTVPDVGMQVGGCPYGLAITPCNATDSSVITAIDGGFYGLIGTSVSSPEFVGALALYEQGAHRQGNLNPFLYRAGASQTVAGGVNAQGPKHYFHRGMSGFDGAYSASTPSYNYNYIFGNGTPDVRNLFGLTLYPAAGIPQTATNP
jgi:subtilase family serine protease